MAAIDKIYLDSYEEYVQFMDWCSEQHPLSDKYGKKVRLIDYVYKYDETFNGGPVICAPYYLDAYIIRNCPLDFIQKELMVNYGYWSQERIRSFYDDVMNWSGEGECPYWAKPEDFIIREDGTIILKGLEKSDYERIKEGELYSSPVKEGYEIGRHFKCTKHPLYKFNTPFRCKSWFVSVKLPDGFNEFMWYHENHNSWDFSSEFVDCDWSSSNAHIRTIKALKRHIIKWKLPVGTKLTVTGRYTFDDYEFIVKK